MSPHRSYAILIITAVFVSCAGEVTNEKVESTGKIKEHLVNANRIFVENEAGQIDKYIERHRLYMETSGTGLRYRIFHKGDGKIAPEEGDTVYITYEVKLLDGTPCYNTLQEPVSFTLGKAEMPKGMEEAVNMMLVGDSAVLILPSHLAYGFTGDGDKIPGNMATVYFLSLIKLKKSDGSMVHPE